MSETNNPFSGLMKIPDSKTMDQDACDDGAQSSNKTNDTTELTAINNIIENVFFFTINKDACSTQNDRQLVYLEEVADAVQPNTFIDLETLEQALFERLLLTDVELSVIPKTCTAFKEHVVQKQVFTYLFSAWQNLASFDSSNQVVKKTVDKIQELIFRNATTALKQPALFEGQDFAEQLVDLLKHVDPESHSFFISIVEAFFSDEAADNHQQLSEVMVPVLRRIHTDINKSNIINLPIYILPSILVFVNNPHLANILMDTCEPKIENNGKLYQDSVLGGLLSLSVLPRSPNAPYEFFDNPMDQSATALMERSIWNATKHLINNLHKIFFRLLKGGPDMRFRILTWIGKCLKANVSRGTLWNMQTDMMNASSMTTASDGFMLNLGAVMLQLSQPFCQTHDDPRSFKIDPTYAAVTPSEAASKSVHLSCLHDETCLMPPQEDEEGRALKRPTADSYGFVTECFYMTHKCIDLGFAVCAEKLVQYGQDLGRTQRALADANEASTSDHLEPIRHRVKLNMTRVLSLRCAILEYDMLSNLDRLQAMTCTWLVQVAARLNPGQPQSSYAPIAMQPIELPLTTPPPDTLRCIPEFVLQNIVTLLTTARRTQEPQAEECDLRGLLPPALTLVLTFMGDAQRTRNPHLRALLAECLEAMLPSQSKEYQPMSSLNFFFRDNMFKEHPHRLELVPSLLHVFVGIEMTGQSVEFEQKFNYRRPMYVVLEFLWPIEEHKQVLSRLAREAESNMEAVSPPIFLRFINLLMNDAIFLLDEALNNMAQIRTMQAAHESGAWNSLPVQERVTNLENLSRTGMFARFDNILGRNTIDTLVRLTSLAPYIFCHPTLVERIASMLNYFLMHLVGPKKKNFKVKDMQEYQFSPAATVRGICRMYVALGDDAGFCRAVCADGRCYSTRLFADAEDVLVRIGGGELISPLQTVAARVASVAEQRSRDEELLANAPEEFLDPIMSSLMLDPVLLPSSRTCVDRTTIARHLLSDQTDPFNRSPLSMDQVKSNTELKERIHAWIAEQKRRGDELTVESTIN